MEGSWVGIGWIKTRGPPGGKINFLNWLGPNRAKKRKARFLIVEVIV